MTDPARWATVRRLFEAALDRDPASRRAWLEQHCGDQPALRDEVLDLLRAEEQASQDEQQGRQPPGAEDLAQALAGDASTLVAGQRLGPFTIRAVLGTGSMGTVYEAEQEHPRRSVALKLMNRGLADDRLRRRFVDEADVLARLDHPAIARVLQAGEASGPGGRPIPWYAMEQVPGARTLLDHAQHAGLELGDRLRLFATIADAVHHGHRQGVIHRDLKPGNLLVGADGSPKVIDFGVARLVHDGARAGTGATLDGELVGTLAYMSPEQTEGRVDVRSDVYALGVVLFELVTGQPPYRTEGDSLGAVLDALRHEPPTPPRRLRPELPEELEWILLQALEKDPDRRYDTAAGMAADVRRLLAGEAVQAGAPSGWYRLRKLVARQRLAVGAGLAVLASLIVGLVISTRATDRAQRAEAAASLQAERATQEADRAQRAEAAASRQAERATREAEHATDQARLARLAEAAEAAARSAAERAAVRARAVTDLLVELFAAPDPALDGYDVSVVAALQSAEARLADELSGQPETEAELRGALGRLYLNLGVFDTAAVHLERSLALQQQLEGSAPAGPATPPGPAPEAVSRREEALALSQALARARRGQGRLDEAAALLEQGLATRRAADTDDEEIPSLLNDLALVRQDQGRTEDAEQLLTTAWEDARRRFGDEDPRAAMVAANLGAMVLERVDLDRAEALLEPAAARLEAALGPAHPLTLTALNSLAGLYAMSDRPEDAMALFERLLSLREERLQGDHPDLVETRANLAVVQSRLGRLDEAVDSLSQALAQRSAASDVVDTDRVVMHQHLVALRLVQGDEAGARADVQALLDEEPGTRADSVRVADKLEVLARVLSEQGLVKEADAVLDQALVLRRRLQGDDSAEELLAQAVAAQGRARQGDVAGAADDLGQLLGRARALQPADPYAVAALAHEQGWMLVVLGRYDQAEPLLLESVALIEEHERVPGELANVRDSCRQLYERWDRPDEARRWRD